jgi:SecD/SecF fusion protein
MLQIDLWKRFVIWGLVALGLAMALPNAFYPRVEAHNDAVAAIEAGGDAPSLIEKAEMWPSWMPSSLVNLGLDLRGGAHLLAEVQVADVYETRIESMWPEIRDVLREERDRVGPIRLQPTEGAQLRVRLVENPGEADYAASVVRGLARPVTSLTGVNASDIDVRTEGADIIVALSEAEQRATDERTLRQALEIVRRRIDEVGTREPTIQRQGADRILIQVPGIGSAAELKEIIGTTAQLTFQPVVSRTTDPGDRAGPATNCCPRLMKRGCFTLWKPRPL